MKFMEIIEKNLSKTVDSLQARNRKITYSNRVRLLLRNEYETLNQSYAALGKFFYENLRDTAEGENADICNVIDGCKERIIKIKADYENVIRPCPKEAEECSEPSDSDDVPCDNEEFADEPADAVNEAENAEPEQEQEAPCCEPEEQSEPDEAAEPMDIKDMSDAEDLPIVDSFVNLTDTASVIDIKSEAEDEEKIDVAAEAVTDEVIATAYSQVQESTEEAAEAEPKPEETPAEPETAEESAVEEAVDEKADSDAADEQPAPEEIQEVEHTAADIIEDIEKLTEPADANDAADEQEPEEKKSDEADAPEEEPQKNDTFKFMNWNRLKDELKDDIDYIVSDSDSKNSKKHKNKK